MSKNRRNFLKTFATGLLSFPFLKGVRANYKPKIVIIGGGFGGGTCVKYRQCTPLISGGVYVFSNAMYTSKKLGKVEEGNAVPKRSRHAIPAARATCSAFLFMPRTLAYTHYCFAGEYMHAAQIVLEDDRRY